MNRTLKLVVLSLLLTACEPCDCEKYSFGEIAEGVKSGVLTFDYNLFGDNEFTMKVEIHTGTTSNVIYKNVSGTYTESGNTITFTPKLALNTPGGMVFLEAGKAYTVKCTDDGMTLSDGNKTFTFKCED